MAVKIGFTSVGGGRGATGAGMICVGGALSPMSAAIGLMSRETGFGSNFGTFPFPESTATSTTLFLPEVARPRSVGGGRIAGTIAGAGFLSGFTAVEEDETA